MSLARTALRIAAVMALTDGYRTAGPWPTLAGPRVYDSRQDPIEGLVADQLVPVIVIYTDDDKGESLSNNNGGPPFERRVALVMELSIGLVGQDDGGALLVSLPQSEPELDAMLDYFEHQVTAVFQDGLSTWGRHLQAVARRVESWQSMRFVEREGHVRLASRQITAMVALQPDADPAVSIGDTAPAFTVPAPLGPLLDAIVTADVPYSPVAEAIRDMLVDNAGALTPIALPAFDSLRMIEAVEAELDADDVPRGARHAGVAQVEF